LIKLSLLRGPIIAGIALIVVVLGASVFDSSYESVEPILKSKQTIIEDKTILPNQFINSTILTNSLKEHNVIIIHSDPSSGLVNLFGREPNGMTFEKESKDGFLYHIIQKSKTEGSYSIQISNSGSEPVKVSVIMGEDPYLSGTCNSSYGIKCYTVPVAIGLVIIGIIAFIVGILLGVTDFRKQNNIRRNRQNGQK
jgi:hypothetical protein